MHACLRTVLTQGKTWGIVRVNPAQGVRLPRKKARRFPVLLAKQDIRCVIDAWPEPTKSIVTMWLVRCGSERSPLCVGSELQPDRIEIVERFYETEFRRYQNRSRSSEHSDSHGILRAVLNATWQRSNDRKPNDLVFGRPARGHARQHGPLHGGCDARVNRGEP